METIFVCFSGIDEIDIRQTLTSCLENSKYPERIYFGIGIQYHQYNRESFKDFSNLKQIEIIFDEVLGVGSTRQMVSLLHNNETYCLQIDAHMIFNKDWDEKIIEYYKAAKQVNNKVLISGYAPSWYRDMNDNIYKEKNTPSQSLTLINDFERSNQPIVGFMPLQDAILVNSLMLYEQKAVSYHFIFSEISMFNELLPDPLIIYNGDEATISLRAITRGYRVYMPNEIILWHLNKSADNFYSNEKRRWQPLFLGKQEPNSLREIRANQQAYDRVKDIFLGNILGYYGAETKEDILWYSSYVGINFEECYIDRRMK